MAAHDEKAELHRYLHGAREALLWKLDGLPEYEVRRPMVATGTNLLGLVKHMAGVEAGYFLLTFDRPFPDPPRWFEDRSEPNADMWATPDESRTDILGLYERVRSHADAAIESLELDAVGHVPWWGESVTLHRVLVHVATEAHRHAGHADILRELIDDAAGFLPDDDNMWVGEGDYWPRHRARLEEAARLGGAQDAP